MHETVASGFFKTTFNYVLAVKKKLNFFLGEPLIFIEVALLKNVAQTIQVRFTN
jgi:hypothetical protein